MSMDDLTQMLSGADSARPLSDGLRSRLEEALIGRSTEVDTDFRGIDEPRPLPPRLRAKLAGKLERRRVAAWQIASAITAAAAVLIGVVVLPSGVRGPAGRPNAMQPIPSVPRPGAGGGVAAPSPSAAPGVVGLPPAMSSDAGSYTDEPFRGSPPPFNVVVAHGMSRPASEMPAPSSQHPGQAPANPAPPPRPVPARIAVTGTDPDIQAGFDAYVDLVRAQGEVGNRRLEIVSPSTTGVLVTVNLGGSPLGGPSTVPVLETLDVASALLTGNVFDIASTPRRQARVLVDRIIATTDLESEATPTAVIYRAGGGEFAGTVPREVETILRDAGILVFTMDYEAGNTTLVPADISFVLMPPAEARSFAREAREAGYAPRLGFAGIWSLYDDAVRSELGTTASVVSPYWSSPTELSAIKRGVEAKGARMGAEAIHGWATAKAIAVALYQSDPRNAKQMAQALEMPTNLGVCSYKLRSGTHERTPDGIMLALTRDDVRPISGSLTDPRP
jgi:hypothetical protein